VRDVVKDLLFEALLDHARRGLARPEARDARLARIVAGDPVDLGVDRVAWDFDAQGLARFVDVGEFGFHVLLDDGAALRLASLAHPSTPLGVTLSLSKGQGTIRLGGNGLP
jgi:hypothetical protein